MKSTYEQFVEFLGLQLWLKQNSAYTGLGTTDLNDQIEPNETERFAVRYSMQTSL